jgi:hypothetical protein
MCIAITRTESLVGPQEVPTPFVLVQRPALPVTDPDLDFRVGGGLAICTRPFSRAEKTCRGLGAHVEPRIQRNNRAWGCSKRLKAPFSTPGNEA